MTLTLTDVVRATVEYRCRLTCFPILKRPLLENIVSLLQEEAGQSVGLEALLPSSVPGVEARLMSAATRVGARAMEAGPVGSALIANAERALAQPYTAV